MNCRRQIILIVLLATMCAAIGGCQIFGWLVNVMIPPKPVPAAYELTPGGKVLVLVDDLGKPVRYEQIKRLLTEKINRLLLDNKAVDQVVSYQDVFRLTAGRKDFNRLGIANITRKLGANQAIYVYLDEFSLKDNPSISLWHGKLGVSVRVVDLEGNTMWPVAHPSGHKPKAAETSQVDNPSPTYGAKIATELADEMALKIARLFYKHSVARGHTPGED